jgi:ATP-dependent protease HslVU (ClpYQ) peptidase subunit
MPVRERRNQAHQALANNRITKGEAVRKGSYLRVERLLGKGKVLIGVTGELENVTPADHTMLVRETNTAIQESDQVLFVENRFGIGCPRNLGQFVILRLCQE